MWPSWPFQECCWATSIIAYYFLQSCASYNDQSAWNIHSIFVMILMGILTAIFWLTTLNAYMNYTSVVSVSRTFLQNTMTSSDGNVSALLTLYMGNSPVNGEFPSQRQVTRGFGVFFYLRLNKRLSKQSIRLNLRRHRAPYDITIMTSQWISGGHDVLRWSHMSLIQTPMNKSGIL